MVAFCLFTVFAILQQTIAFYVQDFLQIRCDDGGAEYRLLFYDPGLHIAFGSRRHHSGPQTESRNPIARRDFQYSSCGLSALHLRRRRFGTSLPRHGRLWALPSGLLTRALRLRYHCEPTTRTQGQAAGYVQSAMSMGFIVGPLIGTGLYQISPIYTNAVSRRNADGRPCT